MARSFGLILGFTAAALALLHGVLTLNPCSILESGLIAANTVACAPDDTPKDNQAAKPL
jgi:hypothetical protein